MTIGTRSVHFGAHAFWLHLWFLAAAWVRLFGSRGTSGYGLPSQFMILDTSAKMMSKGRMAKRTSSWAPELWVSFSVIPGPISQPAIHGIGPSE